MSALLDNNSVIEYNNHKRRLRGDAMAYKYVLTEYTLKKEGITSPLRLVLLADIHERPDDRIAELTRRAKPDLIALAGDIIERRDLPGQDDGEEKKPPLLKRIFYGVSYHLLCALSQSDRHNAPEKTFELLQELAKIAPVYFCRGNHEPELFPEDYEFFGQNGITLLDNSDVTVKAGGSLINIGGLARDEDTEWLRRFSQKKGFKLLLCHYPKDYDLYVKPLDIDLMLAGHNHGGQLRLFGKGVASSGDGLFPKYDKGVFDDRLVVTAGLSNTVAIPRLFNPREVVLIHLIPK